MNISIGQNILKFRKMQGITQAELAEHLSVSSQAVSKWEVGESIPDVYLIPKIAYFFNISIDTLFGVDDVDVIKALVSKYGVNSNEKNYLDAKSAIQMGLNNSKEDVNILMEFSRLEFFRSLECMRESQRICIELMESSTDSKEEKNHLLRVQVMRNSFVLESMGVSSVGEIEFAINFKTSDFDKTFYRLLNTLMAGRYRELLNYFNKEFNTLDISQRMKLSPLIMEAAVFENEIKETRKCFSLIIENEKNKDQVFNAWWLLWKCLQNNNLSDEADICKKELLLQLPNLCKDEFKIEQLRACLMGNCEKPINIF